MNVPEENPRRVLANNFSVDEAVRLLHSDRAISNMQCLQIQVPLA